MAPRNQQQDNNRPRGTPLSDAQEDVLKNITDHEDDDDSNKDIRRNEDDAGDDDEDDTDAVADQDQDDEDDRDEDDPRSRRNEDDDDEDGEEPRQRRQAADDADEDEDDPDKNFQYKQNRNGDILDIDGKILFAKGRSRNAWTKLKQAWRKQSDVNKAVVEHAQALASAGRELLDKYRALQETANQGKTLGLTDKETKDALDLAAMAKRDPKEAAKTILTRMSLGGIDLTSIGVTGPVDAKEVARHMVEQQELARQERIETRQAAAKAAAKEMLQDFLIANPGAGKYLGMIAKAKTDWPHLSLENIWGQLQKSARRAARRANGRDDDPDRRRNFREPPPRNNSRDHRGGHKLSLKAVDPSQSYKQIGRDLLAELQRNEKE